jgi:NAD(P)H dehydrogenase (quinone)
VDHGPFHQRLLAGAGLPEAAAVTMADADRGLAHGDLFVDSGHLRQLIGRPTTTLRDAVAAALG